MKVIDLLNKIANGEENRLDYHRFSQDDYCSIEEFFNRYVIDEENLNLEIIEDTPKEDKKIEKLSNVTIYGVTISSLRNELQATNKRFEHKLNEIIDKINEK